jgi:hypothetical protein
MGMHIRLWKDQSHTKVFRDFATGVIEEYGNFSGTIQTVTVNDIVYYYANSAVFSGVNATFGTPVVSSKDNLGTQGDPQINIFWPDQDFKAVISGRVDGTGDSARYRATLGNILAGSTVICSSTAGYSSSTVECDVWAYTIRLQGFDVDFVYLTYDKIDGYISSSIGIMVSANVFETSLQTRFGRDSLADEDGGYGDGLGGDGMGDTDLPDGSAMPLGGYGLHAYSISDSVYDLIAARLWGKDENIFTALWYKFQNLKFSPIAGIINCLRIPSEFAPGGTSANIQMSGIVMDDLSGAEITYPYTEKDFLYNVPAYYADYNDQQNTHIMLHLPFCGVLELSPAVCGKTLTVHYVCDVLTGNVSARVKISGAAAIGDGTGNGGGYIAQATGNCGYSVPIAGNDNGMGDKLAALTHFATGQAGAVSSMVTGFVSAMGGGNVDLAGGANGGFQLSKNAFDLAGNMIMAKHTTSVVGSLGGGVAPISDLAVRLCIERVPPLNPANYTDTIGRMSGIGGTVGSFSGYTVFSSVHLNVSATDAEQAEIERLLKSGVFL